MIIVFNLAAFTIWIASTTFSAAYFITGAAPRVIPRVS